MALSIKTPEDNNMAVSPLSYYKALKAELVRAERISYERAAEVRNELDKAGPNALDALRTSLHDLEIKGDSRARGVAADLHELEQELGIRGKKAKVERAADTAGGDAGASRSAS